MMKKDYEAPKAEKMEFNYTETIVASYIEDEDETETQKWHGWETACTNNNGNKENGGWDGKKCKKNH